MRIHPHTILQPTIANGIQLSPDKNLEAGPKLENITTATATAMATNAGGQDQDTDCSSAGGFTGPNRTLKFDENDAIGKRFDQSKVHPPAHLSPQREERSFWCTIDDERQVHDASGNEAVLKGKTKLLLRSKVKIHDHTKLGSGVAGQAKLGADAAKVLSMKPGDLAQLLPEQCQGLRGVQQLSAAEDRTARHAPEPTRVGDPAYNKHSHAFKPAQGPCSQLSRLVR